MPRIKRKDANNRRVIKDWFESKEGQDTLRDYVQEEHMTDPYGRPISVMLPEAEVSTLGNKDRDLSKDGLMVLREAAGFAPIVGEFLDLAELNQIRKTGKDFYGDDSNTALRAGLLAGGLLLPNVIERPAKGAFKLIKKALENSKEIKRAVPNQSKLNEYVGEGKYILDQLRGTNVESKIKTGAADAAITVKHGTHAGDLTSDKIKLFEDVPTLGARPGKAKLRKTELEKPGGFYTARGDQGKFFGTDSKTHQIQLDIPKGSKYIDLSDTGMSTDVMAKGDLQKLYQDGYDYIIGKNITGFEEIIPINPEILKSFKYNYGHGGKIKTIKKRPKGMRVRKSY